MTDVPAFVRNDRLDVLAANRLGRAFYSRDLRRPDPAAEHRPVRVPQPSCRPSSSSTGTASPNDTVGILRQPSRPRPLRQAPLGPHRRAVHPQRRVPGPLGRPRRQPPPQRRQALPPPRRRRPHPRPSKRSTCPATPASRCSSTRPSRAPRRRRPWASSPAGQHPRRPSYHPLRVTDRASLTEVAARTVVGSGRATRPPGVRTSPMTSTPAQCKGSLDERRDRPRPPNDRRGRGARARVAPR